MREAQTNADLFRRRDTLEGVRRRHSRAIRRAAPVLLLVFTALVFAACNAADGLIGIHSAFLPGNNQVPAPAVTISSDTVATGGTTTLTADGSGDSATYTWSVASGEGSVDAEGGTVTFTASDSAGTVTVSVVASAVGFQNSDAVEANVLVADLPVISFDESTDVVFVDNTVNLSVTGGGSGATYTWEIVSGAGSIDSAGETVAFTAPSSEGSATVQVTAASAGFSDVLQAETAVTVRDNHFALLTFTDTGTNLNASMTIPWTSSAIDSAYFDNAAPEQLEVLQDGDYFLALTIPFFDTGNAQRAVPVATVYVNGGAVSGAVSESSYMRHGTTNEHDESSNHLAILLDDLNAGDTIEVRMSTGGIAGTVNVQDAEAVVEGQATLYAEYINPSRTIFAGTATRTVASTNLNQTTFSPLEWTAVKASSGFTHSGEDITLDEAGYYLVHANLPTVMGDPATVRFSIEMRVNLDGSQVDGGSAKQGYIRNQNGHDSATVHWSGLVYAPTAGLDLTISAGREPSMTQTTAVNVNGVATVFVEKLGSPAFVYSGRARDPVTDDDWNSSGALELAWDQGNTTIDTVTYEHSISSSAEQITIQRSGDYLVLYNDVLYTTSAPAANIRTNPRIVLELDGTAVSGAVTKTHYIRNDATDGHTAASASLVFYLEGVTAGQVLTVTTQQESVTGEVRSADDALLTIIRKK